MKKIMISKNVCEMRKARDKPKIKNNEKKTKKQKEEKQNGIKKKKLKEIFMTNQKRSLTGWVVRIRTSGVVQVDV